MDICFAYGFIIYCLKKKRDCFANVCVTLIIMVSNALLSYLALLFSI